MSTAVSSPSMSAVRQASIEGLQVTVVDSLLSDGELSELYSRLIRSDFQRTESDRDDTAEYKTWARNLPNQIAARMAVYSRSVEAVSQFATSDEVTLHRAYCNATLFGDMLFSHDDCGVDVPGYYTALWFVCEEWDKDWGGETVFFNNEDDAEFAVSPRPGRLALFDGRIRHCGRAPNRICYATRLTLAFKFYTEQARQRINEIAEAHGREAPLP